MSRQKIVIIGGGSLGFTPYLVKDFILSGFGDSEVVLVDLNAEVLELMQRFTRLIAQHLGSPLRIASTTDRCRALPDADFVINTVGVAGQDLLQAEIHLCQQYGIWHTTGDTVGPAGLSRALRTIPVLLDICQDVERLCPRAWLINYTNPMSSCCLAANLHSTVQAVGLCHGTQGTVQRLAETLEVDAKRLFVRAAGVNHLVWFQDCLLDGKEATPCLREEPAATKLRESQPVSYRLLELYGLYPSPGDRHVAEFFPHFLRQGTGQFEKYGFQLRDYGAIFARKAEVRQGILDRLEGRVPLEDLSQFSGEAASELMAGLLGQRPGVFDVNILNRGCIPGLPDECVVEVPAVADAAGLHGERVRPLPPAITALLHQHAMVQGLTVEAAVRCCRRTALQALLADPLAPDPDRAEQLLDGLLALNAEKLPPGWRV